MKVQKKKIDFRLIEDQGQQGNNNCQVQQPEGHPVKGAGGLSADSENWVPLEALFCGANTASFQENRTK